MVRSVRAPRLTFGLLLGTIAVGVGGFLLLRPRVRERIADAAVGPNLKQHSRAIGTRRERMARMFANEPRANGWADIIEREIGSKVIADVWSLFPAVLPRDFTCRTSTCRFRYRLQNPSDLTALQQLLIALRAADGYQSESAGDEAELYLFYSGESLPSDDANATARAYASSRAQRFADFRARRLPLPAGVRIQDLPRE